MRIGIARALLYFWYGPAWESFLAVCRFAFITSPPTGREQLELGVRAAQNEVCLPVKVYLGHVRYLVERERVDALLLPHLVQIDKKQFICPKFMGLPDMVRTILPPGFPLYIWQSRKGAPLWSADGVPRQLREAVPKAAVLQALRAAEERHRLHWAELSREPAADGKLTVGIIAHPYCLYDDYLNLRLADRLKSAGTTVLVPEMVPAERIARCPGLNKPLFWTFGRRGLAAAQYYLDRRVDGIIHLTAFACGPESMVGEVVERRFGNRGPALLRINLDEQAGEAGLVTRLEAFLDLLARRKRSAAYIPSDGRGTDPSGNGPARIGSGDGAASPDQPGDRYARREIRSGDGLFSV